LGLDSCRIRGLLQAAVFPQLQFTNILGLHQASQQREAAVGIVGQLLESETIANHDRLVHQGQGMAIRWGVENRRRSNQA
jgi:hypothetical protein